jgi:hypothetical protein
MFALPLWVYALLLAALAPWVARALQAALEDRRRRRTLEFLRDAGLDAERRGSVGRGAAANGMGRREP